MKEDGENLISSQQVWARDCGKKTGVMERFDFGLLMPESKCFEHLIF